MPLQRTRRVRIVRELTLLHVLSPSLWGNPCGLSSSSFGQWVDMVVVVGGHLVCVTCHAPDFSDVIKEHVA